MKTFNVLVLLIVLSCLTLDQANASTYDISELYDISLDDISELYDISQEAAPEGRSLFPSLKKFWKMGKQVLMGYPFQLVSSVINKICSTVVSSSAIKLKETPDISKMYFQLRKPCKRFTFPLLEADQMWCSPQFDANKKVVILATGWTTTVNGSETIDAFAKAYNCRNDFNFVALDTANYVKTLYSWSALNTKAIGEAMAKGLVELTDVVPVENIHLIGHSLGAHIVGAAARKFSELTGKIIPHITALDPANPCFNDAEKLPGIQRGDAKFIDVIHTNPGTLGKREPLGDVDFYPNGLDPLPPGCFSIVCAHERSWQYYLETVYPYNENNFEGEQCYSLSNLRDRNCPGPAVPMGFTVPHNVRGIYLLEVNKNEPFGTGGSKSRRAEYAECGLCKL